MNLARSDADLGHVRECGQIWQAQPRQKQMGTIPYQVISLTRRWPDLGAQVCQKEMGTIPYQAHLPDKALAISGKRSLVRNKGRPFLIRYISLTRPWPDLAGEALSETKGDHSLSGTSP